MTFTPRGGRSDKNFPGTDEIFQKITERSDRKPDGYGGMLCTYGLSPCSR